MKKLFKVVLIILLIATTAFFISRYIYKTEYISIINNECSKYNVDSVEILSIIKAESNFKANAISTKNALGLMQLTLGTANWCAEQLGIDKLDEKDLLNPETNIKLGVFYYNYLWDRYKSTNTALAAYNGGMGNVDKWLTDEKYSKDGIVIDTTPYPETTRYITKINNNIKIYRLLYKEF